MRKELFSFILLICLTFTCARTFRVRQAAGLPWDPPVQNLGQSVAVNGADYDYTLTLAVAKSVSSVSAKFAFTAPVSAVASATEGWTAEFDGTTVTANLKQMVIGGTTIKVTIRVKAAAGFNFPSLITTTCEFDGQPETQEFRFQPGSPLPPAEPVGPENFIATAGQKYSTDGLGTYQFTYTFQAYKPLSTLSVSFSFPNTEVVTIASATAGATAASQDGIVTVTYANPILAETTISTTVTVTTTGAFNLPTKFDFTTSTEAGPQTQTLQFKGQANPNPNPNPAPTAAQKPLGFSHLNHGIKQGRGYLEIAYHLDITAGSNLDSWYAQMQFPIAISKAESDAQSVSTLSADNGLKIEYKTPVAAGTKLSVTAYLKVTSYASLQLPQAIDFYYTVAGTQHHSKVKFN